ncbi:MAG: hypothetical protein OHK0039_25430 [Bacteroidia bacterium]
MKKLLFFFLSFDNLFKPAEPVLPPGSTRIVNLQEQTCFYLIDGAVKNRQGQTLAFADDTTLTTRRGKAMLYIDGNQILGTNRRPVGSLQGEEIRNLQGQTLGYVRDGDARAAPLAAAYFLYQSSQDDALMSILLGGL